MYVGYIIAEYRIFLTGFTLLGSELLASYFWDFLLAYLLGILFHDFAIAPLRNASSWLVIRAALKAGTVTLIAFEVGLSAFMVSRYTRAIRFDPFYRCGLRFVRGNLL
jgi:hypothetical protein